MTVETVKLRELQTTVLMKYDAGKEPGKDEPTETKTNARELTDEDIVDAKKKGMLPDRLSKVAQDAEVRVEEAAEAAAAAAAEAEEPI
jgi:hypothetical protein